MTQPAGRSNFVGMDNRDHWLGDRLLRDRIVFLCTGNICRSPLAEVIAVQKFGETGLSFSSAGLNAMAGLPATMSSAQYAVSHGADLAGHQAQPVTERLLSDTAWVIGMTRSHAAIFRSRYGHHYPGAVGILSMAGLDLAQQTHSPDAEEVDDPYGLAHEQYVACGDQISRLLAGWQATFTNLRNAINAGTAQEDE